ncbi:hypothetical protein BJY01DRAFT_255666 [Aspergillus pseudoustus]|uniref:Uncharacterized protein n=1 Tax=Aspergillus pseudoustus TaxID=1810923 RepID=A0ABR4II77_9EURO
MPRKRNRKRSHGDAVLPVPDAKKPRLSTSASDPATVRKIAQQMSSKKKKQKVDIEQTEIVQDNTEKRKQKQMKKSKNNKKKLVKDEDKGLGAGSAVPASPREYRTHHASHEVASLKSSSCAASDESDCSVSSDIPSEPAPIPCVECAKKVFAWGNDGKVTGPNECLFNEVDLACVHCVEQGMEEFCEPLPRPCHAMFVRLRAMKPDLKAYAAALEFEEELQDALNAWNKNPVVQELRVLNRNLLRLVNVHLEAASKEPLGDEHLEDWTGFWAHAEKLLKFNHGL